MLVEANGKRVKRSAELNRPPQGSRVSVYMATKSERSARRGPGYQMGLSNTKTDIGSSQKAKAKVVRQTNVQ